eukprot:scaffold113327_cov66-Phaeocystis_antarctica.AAC.1
MPPDSCATSDYASHLQRKTRSSQTAGGRIGSCGRWDYRCSPVPLAAVLHIDVAVVLVDVRLDALIRFELVTDLVPAGCTLRF